MDRNSDLIILGEWNTHAGRKPFQICLIIDETRTKFVVCNSEGKSTEVNREQAMVWLRSSSDIVKIASQIQKYLPEYFN
jgi:hypothetical protein